MTPDKELRQTRILTGSLIAQKAEQFLNQQIKIKCSGLYNESDVNKPKMP